jgi:prepilin signal peptidase PulO-like enzyme (type II secretory pathway)
MSDKLNIQAKIDQYLARFTLIQASWIYGIVMTLISLPIFLLVVIIFATFIGHFPIASIIITLGAGIFWLFSFITSCRYRHKNSHKRFKGE